MEAHLTRIFKHRAKSSVVILHDIDEYRFPGYGDFSHLDLPCSLHNTLRHEFFRLKNPSQGGRAKLLDILKRYVNIDSRCDLQGIAGKMNGFSPSDILSVVTLAVIKCRSRGGTELGPGDIDSALCVVRTPSALRGKMLCVRNISLEHIGGLHPIKHRLRTIFEWPIVYADSFEKLGLGAPRGVLLCGPPGCSKTSLVRAIASMCGLNFFFLDSSRLYSQYVGESEKILRDTFAEARRSAPSIIFIDEIDTIVGRRDSDALCGRSASGGSGVQEGIITTLLNEMDGVVSSSGVVVVGATNRPDNIDNAILRPGRIDFVLNVPLPGTSDRLEILELATKSLVLHQDVNLESIARCRTDGFSGADLISVCTEAAMAAMREGNEYLLITAGHFEAALNYVRNN